MAKPRPIDTGLTVAPDDAGLTGDRGEAKAAKGDAEGALGDWRGAHELDPENFAPACSSAFLLEREGRLAEAAEAWRYSRSGAATPSKRRPFARTIRAASASHNRAWPRSSMGPLSLGSTRQAS